MGSFIDNMQVRSSDAESVVVAVEEILARQGLTVSRAGEGGEASPRSVLVGASRNGWVAVFDSDEFAEPSLAPAISALLHQPTIRLLVNDSDSWHYRLFRNGELIDSFDSVDEESMDWDAEFEDEEDIAEKIIASMSEIHAQVRSRLPGHIQEVFDRVSSRIATPDEQQFYNDWARDHPEVFSASLQVNSDGNESDRDVSEHIKRLKELGIEFQATRMTKILCMNSGFAEESLAGFLRLLGAADVCASLSFRYLRETSPSDLAEQGLERFRLGSSAPRDGVV